MTINVTLKETENDTQLHLYLAWGCPFCHRVSAAIAVLGLNHLFTVTWMNNVKPDSGWKITAEEEPLFNASTLDILYQKLGADKNQARSVPLLVNKVKSEILSTESTEIVRFISTGLNGLITPHIELAPEQFLQNINNKNEWLHGNVNRAVYLVGFATEESDYQNKLTHLFEALDEIEDHLNNNAFLIGHQLTESDLFLLATLERFDSIYYTLFRCNLRYIKDYPNLHSYHQRIRQISSLKKTYNNSLTLEHYSLSTMHVNGKIRHLSRNKMS